MFFKSVWSAIAGISAEILLAYIFILAGFLACMLWWGITKR